MEGPSIIIKASDPQSQASHSAENQPVPFAQQWVTITRQEQIEQKCRINYLEVHNRDLRSKLEKSLQEIIRQKAKNKDLQNRLFGKKSEQKSSNKSEKGHSTDNETANSRKRGQQKGSKGHGRTERPDLPIIHEEHDPGDEQKICVDCRLPHRRTPAL